jgi:hypothetical protein
MNHLHPIATDSSLSYASGKKKEEEVQRERKRYLPSSFVQNAWSVKHISSPFLRTAWLPEHFYHLF